MSKKVEELVPSIIKLADYKEELEAEVKFRLSQAPVQKKNTKKYGRVVYPERFETPFEEEAYQVSEFMRCINGYDGMCGKMYFWHNYCKLTDPELGIIRPTYRTVARDWFQFIEDHQKQEQKRGIVAIKRRRIGASWMASADVLHDCMFNPFYKVGMNSNSADSSADLFSNIKFIYQQLPDWMRPSTKATNRTDFLEFATSGKDAAGNKGGSKTGPQSWIRSVAPTDNAHEGKAYSKLIIDEAGKQRNLLKIWSFAQDCLMKPPRRVGLPIIFGTVGDIDKDGKGLMDMWINHEVYKFDRFFFYGHNAMDGMIDDFGNDMTEDAIRFIIYERHRLYPVKSDYEAFIQKYPLDELDAFNQVTGGGVGDIKTINEQITNLTENPPMMVVGKMRRKPEGGVDFVPDPHGKITIYERPDDRINGYHATVDPCEDDDVKKSRDSSDMAMVIGAKPFGTSPKKLVAEYTDRPLKLDEYYEQAIMLAQWYNNVKITIEMNKGGWRMRKYVEEHAPKLLGLSPVAATSAKGGVEMRVGVKMTAERKEQMMGLMEDCIDNESKFIPSIKLLKQHKVFGDAHADDDLAIAWGWFLIICQSDRSIAKSRSELGQNLPNMEYVRNRNGFALKVNGEFQQRPQDRIKPKSAIFKH